jgi:hypothetical protein
MLRRTALPTALLIAALALVPASAVAQDAQAVADRVLQALGGKEAWDNTRYIHFTFAGRRTHWWDKWTGRYRVEGQNREGQKYVVLTNINTKEGTAYLNGQKAEGDQAKQLLEAAYGAWVNDTYWLLMPYKLKDPGVNLSPAGEETIDGKTYDKLALSFESVGLTPGDRYWAYINRDTGLMDRWSFILQDMPKEGPPSVWLWTGWQKHGNIMLAPHRSHVGDDRKLELSDIAVPDQIPDSVFTSTEPVQ